MKWHLKSTVAAVGVACGAWALSAAPARADAMVTVYDNLAFPSTFSDSVRSVNPNNGNPDDGPLGLSFSVDRAMSLADVQLKVQLQSRTVSPTASVTASLLADNGTSPGALIAVLGTFFDRDLTRTSSIVDLAVSGVQLTAGRYWIVLSTEDNSRVGWAAAGGDGSGSTYGEGPGDWGVGGEGEYFYAAGALNYGWDTTVFANGPSPYYPYQMAVIGAVPEPASLAVLGLGVGALGLLKRRKPAAPAAALA